MEHIYPQCKYLIMVLHIKYKRTNACVLINLPSSKSDKNLEKKKNNKIDS